MTMKRTLDYVGHRRVGWMSEDIVSVCICLGISVPSSCMKLETAKPFCSYIVSTQIPIHHLVEGVQFVPLI